MAVIAVGDGVGWTSDLAQHGLHRDSRKVLVKLVVVVKRPTPVGLLLASMAG